MGDGDGGPVARYYGGGEPGGGKRPPIRQCQTPYSWDILACPIISKMIQVCKAIAFFHPFLALTDLSALPCHHSTHP